MESPKKIINASIIIIIILAIAGALYPVLATYVTNISTSQYCAPGTLGATCNGTATYGTWTSYTNGALLTVTTVLYWILIAAGIVLYMMKSFGISLRRM